MFDMQQPCFAGWHKAWALGLGLPANLALCIGVPAILCLLLVLNRGRRLQDSMFTECMGFVYHNYREKMYLWEIVNIFQIQALVAVSVFAYSLGVYFSVVLLHLALAQALVLQYACHPFILQLLNHTSVVSSSCLSLTSSLSLTLYKGDTPAP